MPNTILKENDHIKKLLGHYFLYKDEIWICVKYQGVDMFDYKSVRDGRLICIPYFWTKIATQTEILSCDFGIKNLSRHYLVNNYSVSGENVVASQRTFQKMVVPIIFWLIKFLTILSGILSLILFIMWLMK